MNTLAVIHIAKKELGIDAEAYNAMLSHYGVDSSKNLNEKQRLELIATFEKMGFQVKRKKPLRYSHLPENRKNDIGEKFASPSQLRMIEAMWMTNPSVEIKTVDAMNRFVKRIIFIDNIEWLLMKDVQRIVKAIKSISSIQELHNAV